MSDDPITCPKCQATSGDNWTQCQGRCPMSMSPHYDEAWTPNEEAEERPTRDDEPFVVLAPDRPPAPRHIEWRAGPPPYDERGRAPAGDRYVHLELHDQGGWPFKVVGYLHGEYPEGHDVKADIEALAAWRKSWSGIDDAPPAPRSPGLAPWLHVPCLKVDQPLSSWWNIDWHAEIPTLPDTPVIPL